ncbi:MAG: hypothetical protein ABIG61_14860 [Planctomycetota bacterium]
MDESVSCVLEQYKCRRCGRYFYVHKGSKRPMEFDFGCAFGCDDSGEYLRDIKAEIISAKLPLDNQQNKKEIRDHRIIVNLSEGDFIESMGREPENQSEFNIWAQLAEKGLLNGHIDWGIIYECTKDAMPTGDE